MKQGKIIGFNAAKMAEQMMANAVAEQNRRLVEYAKDKVVVIGDTIRSYNSKHHMDAIGNLLDSLCWGVGYDGKMIESGFYRGQRASRPSILHAFYGDESVDLFVGGTKRWKQIQNAKDKATADWLLASSFEGWSPGEPVNGHALAEAYLAKAEKNCKEHQWTVFFAILAPYWGYWEEGFRNVRTGTFMQFQVMTEFYDVVKADLKPAKTRLKVHVEKYASSRIDIYDYLYNLLFGVVSENVYDMRVPQELTESDTTDGFLVIHVGSIVDESEFVGEAYGRVRCFIEAYVPQISRGRVNHDIYAAIENSINSVIKEQTETNDGTYYIEQDSILSMDDVEESTSDNSYFTFVKSFIVVIDKQSE